MVKTKICDLLNITYPILQGGMAHISDAKLAAAVSNAGGLGIISAASGDVEAIAKQIDIARTLTDKPIGVNVMLLGRNTKEIMAMLIEKKIDVVTTGAGDPGEYIPDLKAAGIKVIPVVPSVALAKRVERDGADAVIAEGGESGGHIGKQNTMALVPMVVDGVDIPVIAAGGIADGRGIAAALMLGAEGVQIGTRFLVATECNVAENYKQKILKANDTSTIVTGRRLGHPVRSIKTAFSRGYAKIEYTDISDADLDAYAVGSLRAAVVDGDDKKGCFLAGQIAGMVDKEESVADMMKDLVAGTESVLSKFSK